MNRRPGFKIFGRGTRRGRSKSGFFGWVTLPAAVDIAPVWDGRTQPGGGGAYGRWGSGQRKPCPSGQVRRSGRGCVSPANTNASTMNFAFGRIRNVGS